ncbi:interferon-inducible GTPase 5-like [Paramuricea clavata]|uniref:Interferon-inducible GTPase 5-like n=1 Tax=Paramuricea clavata TaxID=317549 RepID=A0A6S7HW97_PARCT|nr:interferon-inducible GTPase 5-like [Paramuricea clavata]
MVRSALVCIDSILSLDKRKNKIFFSISGGLDCHCCTSGSLKENEDKTDSVLGNWNSHYDDIDVVKKEHIFEDENSGGKTSLVERSLNPKQEETGAGVDNKTTGCCSHLTKLVDVEKKEHIFEDEDTGEKTSLVERSLNPNQEETVAGVDNKTTDFDCCSQLTKLDGQLSMITRIKIYEDKTDGVLGNCNSHYVGDTSDLTQQYLTEARTCIKQNCVSGIEEFIRKKLEEWKDVKIRFGITGDSGAGKSAFINAIRGKVKTLLQEFEYAGSHKLKDDDVGAAEVDMVDATTEPTEYHHPNNPIISFVHLPGIGRFIQNDLELATKVKSIGKSFFFIRTKIDYDGRLKDEKPINEADILEKIRQNYLQHVKDLISSEKENFLISNYHKDKWDFNRLIAGISDASPVLQRECLTLSLSNLTPERLKRKAKFFKAQAFAVVTVSAETGVFPVPGVGGAIEVALIEGMVIAGSISFFFTLRYLLRSINELEVAAMVVWDNAAKQIIHNHK